MSQYTEQFQFYCLLLMLIMVFAGNGKPLSDNVATVVLVMVLSAVAAFVSCWVLH